jgi:hydroxymethylpyrimidine pyrophosphatase-like HAD family hydrolase
MNGNPKQPAETISALLTDVDGTLVTKDKVLTDRALAAIRQLRERGIVFTITSGRPPFGMKMLVEPLGSRCRKRRHELNTLDRDG